jgi:hypothetical protein
MLAVFLLILITSNSIPAVRNEKYQVYYHFLFASAIRIISFDIDLATAPPLHASVGRAFLLCRAR